MEGGWERGSFLDICLLYGEGEEQGNSSWGVSCYTEAREGGGRGGRRWAEKQKLALQLACAHPPIEGSGDRT